MRTSAAVLLTYVLVIAAAAAVWLLQMHSKQSVLEDGAFDALCASQSAAGAASAASAARIDAAYVVRVALVLVEPEARPTDIDVMRFVEALRAFVRRAAPAIDIDVTFEMLFDSALHMQPLLVRRTPGGEQCYAVHESNVSVALQPRHWFQQVGSHEHGTVHIALIVPPPRFTPFCVHAPSRGSTSTAFELFEWGAGIFLNTRSADELEVALEYAAAVLAKRVPLLAQADRSALLRDAIAAHVASTTFYLCSLQRILLDIPAIDAGAEARALAQRAFAALQRVEHTRGLSLDQRATAARDAASAAREAFMHHSIIGQLYFPPEHVYAVYMPLVLPALLPVASNLIVLLRRWRAKRAERRAGAPPAQAPAPAPAPSADASPAT